MAGKAQDDKPAAAESRPDSGGDSARFVYGPRPLSALLPPVVRPAFRGHGAATAQLLADWGAIVGPTYAALTTPRRLVSGTLTIACSGPVAMELQHVAPLVIERINASLGRAAVTGLRFVQAPPTARPVAPARPVPRPAAEAAQKAVAGMPEGELRDALERLGRAVLARRS